MLPQQICGGLPLLEVGDKFLSGLRKIEDNDELFLT